MNSLIDSINRIEDHYLKRNMLVRFCFTKYGLKNFGASRLLGSKYLVSIDNLEIAPFELFLGPDYLKNEYTLLDCNVVDSPHFGLMQAMNEGGPIGDTEYMHRYLEGTLDWRRGSPKLKNFEHFYKRFQENKTIVLSGENKPVIVYKMEDHIYIYDGKHRAALCALLERPVKCMMVNSEIANADMWHYMFTLLDGKSEYSKHTQFHNLYLQQLNNHER